MTDEDIKNKIIDFYNSKEYIELSSYYSYKNYFEILKIARDENVHSSFIAWLLNPYENHGLGVFSLSKFFLLLAWAKINLPCNKQSYFSEDILKSILSNDIKIEDTKITREYVIEGRQRIDILFLIKIQTSDNTKILPIILENKVNSDEHGSNNTEKMQTEQYYEWAQKNYNNEDFFPPMFVFLAPIQNAEIEETEDLTDRCKCNKYIIINYQILNNYVIEPCKQNLINESARYLINNYQRCLSYSDKEVNIMATNEEQKELLVDFWNNNKELLNAALSALIDDPDITEDDRNVMNKAFTTISKKDKTKYLFNGEIYGKGRLVLAVIKDYVNKHPNISYEELDKIFGKARGNNSCIINNKEIKEDSRVFNETISLDNGESISVSTEWGIGNIGGFIQVATNLGYTIIPQ